MSNHLFAVYLGGRVPKCNTELHDVVFVAGDAIEQTYQQLMDRWFGDPRRMHIDSWVALDVVDGHRVTLSSSPSASTKKLYFINLGGYAPGQFTELHANTFLVSESEKDVKARAKRMLLPGAEELHTDDLKDVDDCIELGKVRGLHVHLEPTAETRPFEPVNGYHVLPKDVVAAYVSSRSRSGSKPSAAEA